jgi:putative ABC transport system permease protein
MEPNFIRRRAGLLEDLLHDTRIGLRSLARQMGFGLVAVGTLALGIGIFTTFFTVVNGVLLKPLPYAAPERLVELFGGPKGVFWALKDDTKTMDIEAYTRRTEVNLSISGAPERVVASAVSGELLSLLGIPPQLGRTFRRGEDVAGQGRFVVLSHGFWQQRFGGNPGVLGGKILVDGVSCEVVGVMPEGFWFPSADTQLWMPMELDPKQTNDMWGVGYLRLIGRLRPGASIDAARTELRTFIPKIREMFPWRMPENWQRGATATPLQTVVVGESRTRLLLLFGATIFVLIIACVNVANLLLARGIVRQRDFALSAALGATRGRLVRHALTETLILGALGGAAGIALTVMGVPLLSAFLPPDTPRLVDVDVDLRVMAVALGASILTAALAGLVPALIGSAFHRNAAAKGWERAQKGSSPWLRRWGSALLIGEVAIAVTLTIGAGLLIKSFIGLEAIDPGFRTERLLTLQISMPENRCAERPGLAAQRAPSQRHRPCRPFLDEVLSRVRSIAEVRDAAIIDRPPLADRVFEQPFQVELDQSGGSAPMMLWWHVVSPRYTETMDIRLVRGRTLDERDRAGSGGPLLVNESLARRLWPGEDPIGKRLRPVWQNDWRTVVGVVADVRYRSLAQEGDAEAYGLYGGDEESPIMSLMVRTVGEPLGVARAVRQFVAEIDRDAAVSGIQTMDAFVRTTLGKPRSTTQILGIFAGLALILAIVGVYGVISFRVIRLVPEIGLRMALGAQSRDIRLFVLGRAGLLALIGIVAGLLGAVALGRVLSGQLYNVDPMDPAVFAIVPLVIAAAVVVALYFPARQAGRIDPIVAMRVE